MAGAIVWFVIILWIIVRVKKQSEQAEERRNPEKRMAGREKRAEKTVNKRTKRPAQNYAKTNQRSRTKTTGTYTNQGTYTIPKNNMGGGTNVNSEIDVAPEDLIAQGDILKAANNEVKKQHTEDHNKVLVNQMKDVHEDSFAFDDSPESAEERMKKVRDLMITGYGGNLEFQRDFIAEGMDLLNKYTANY
ncbi:MAG: hypothetical protein K6E13_03020 [Lachnospiraceae bacterium]|nr:hypothetical protein [Lachnospiraceae bacterium]